MNDDAAKLTLGLTVLAITIWSVFALQRAKGFQPAPAGPPPPPTVKPPRDWKPILALIGEFWKFCFAAFVAWCAVGFDSPGLFFAVFVAFMNLRAIAESLYKLEPKSGKDS